MSKKITSTPMYIRDKSTGRLVPVSMIASSADETLAEIKQFADQTAATVDQKIEQKSKEIDEKCKEIDQKGQEVLASIPDDYLKLSESIAEIEDVKELELDYGLFRFDENWNRRGTADSKYRYRFLSNVINAVLNFSYFGNGFSIYGQKGSDFGQFAIYIDGQLYSTVDCYNVTSMHNVKLFTVNLGYGKHDIELKVVNKSSAAIDNYISLYFIDIVNFNIGNAISGKSINFPTRLIKPDDNLIGYYGKHIVTANMSGAILGYVKCCNGGKVTIPFYGNRAKVYCTLSGDSGKYAIYLDGVIQGSGDFYHVPNISGNVQYATQTLNYGWHLIEFVNIGKNERSAGDYLYVEGIEVTNDTTFNFADYVTIEDFGGVGDSDTDCTFAFNIALNYAMNTGKKIKLLGKNYKINGQIVIPNGAGRQHPLIIEGCGCYHDGQELGLFGGTILDLHYSGVAKILTLGVGMLEMNGITFTDSNIGSDGTPFILTTYTTLMIHNCAFVGTRRGTSCNQDAIVLGGTQENETRYESNQNYGFQGYGTVIRENYFLGIRRAVWGRVFANSVVVQNNNIWRGCGSNLGDGCAIEFDDCAENAWQYDAGGMISGNLIEVCYYPYAIKLLNARFFNLHSNNLYDAGSANISIAGVYLGENAKNNYITYGYNSYGYGNMAKLEDYSDGSNIIIDSEVGIICNSMIINGNDNQKYKISVDNGNVIASRTN